MLTKIKKYNSIIFLWVGVALALYVRYLCLDFESFDYMGFISKWVNYYAENGRWYALKNQIGDYNVVYQYILVICSYFKLSSLYTVKFVSVMFDFLLAWGCCRCLSLFNVSKKARHIAFVVVLLLPTVWLNSALWCQCDSIYVCFIVWSLYFKLKERYYLSVVFTALAFTFKLQTVFFMPVYLVLLIKKQVKIRHLLIFPLTYFVTCIPALAFGKPFADIIGIYLNQTAEYPWLSMNAPTIWQMTNIVTPNDTLKKIGIILAALVIVAFLVLCLIKRGKLNSKTVLSLSLVFAVGIPFFLPHMHDRYFYMADIISVIYAFVFGIRRIHIPILVQYASLTCYLNYIGAVNLYGGNILPHIMTGSICGAAMLTALMQLIIYWYRDFVSKKEKTSDKLNFLAPIIVIVALVGINAVDAPSITIKVNNKKVYNVGVEPYEYEDTIMVPIKGFLNSCGYFITVSHETGNIVAKKEGEIIEFDFAHGEAIINGEKTPLKYPYSNINSNNFLSAYDLSVVTNMKVKYEDLLINFSK